VDRRSSTIQRQRTLEIEGSMSWCNVKRSQGWTEWIQPRSQPRRHKESIIQLDGINERRKRDEHVLGAQYVPVDRYACNVAEINWRYYQQFDSSRRLSLGRECTFQLQQLSYSGWGNSNLLNGRSPAFARKWFCSIQKVKFLLASFKRWYWSVKVWTSFRWHLDTII